jgi:hypothetical protein
MLRVLCHQLLWNDFSLIFFPSSIYAFPLFCKRATGRLTTHTFLNINARSPLSPVVGERFLPDLFSNYDFHTLSSFIISKIYAWNSGALSSVPRWARKFFSHCCQLVSMRGAAKLRWAGAGSQRTVLRVSETGARSARRRTQSQRPKPHYRSLAYKMLL